MSGLRAIVHASELLTGAGVETKRGRRVKDDDLGRIPDGALVYKTRIKSGKPRPDRIEWVGPTKDLPRKFLKLPRQNLRGRRALIPGLIDCHTHLIFAGDRSLEFAARCGGASYEEIAARGGGISASVEATRAASPRALETLAVARLKEAYSFGVRTLEVKSGYGLSWEQERKILEVIPKLRKRFPEMRLTSTFLGAHAIPKGESRASYLTALTETMLPEVARLGLADACDVFVDEGYFTIAEARKLLTQARALGLNVKLHADELGNTESAALGAELGALSADHLLRISDQGVQALARSETVAVLLPGTAFYLKLPYPPARKLLDAGACVALSTDFNPGTCPTLNLPVVMTIAALYLGMTQAELFAGVTYNAARALGLEAVTGALVPGKAADFAVLPFARFEELYYRFAWAPA